MKHLDSKAIPVLLTLLLVPAIASGEPPHEATAECLAWIEQTYRIDALTRDLGLELADEATSMRACVRRDMRRVPQDNPVQYCDPVFKVHCSGVDLLTEIGEAQLRRCEERLRGSWSPRQLEAWKTCAQHKVFERYSSKGEPIDEAACRAAIADDCATDADAAIEKGETEKPDADARRHREARRQRSAAWPGWGGPGQDFRAPAAGLATSWPEDGPEKLWSRELGDGYSAILAEDGRLYTMYSLGREREAVVCLDARTGETVWERRYEHDSHENYVWQFGDGPNSTPLIAGDLLFTIGVAGKMHALKKADGEVVWSRELWGEELGGNVLKHGYSSSPVAYEDMVIAPVGGDHASLVAFDQKTGDVRWKAPGFENSYSSPRLARVAGEEQILMFMAEELIGVDPDDGELRWRYPHGNQWKHNVSVPAVVNGDTVFLSSPQAGARGLRLIPDGDAIRVEEIWFTRRVQLYHVSSVQVDDWVYGSSGTSVAFMTAVNARTGEVGWRERGFAKANCVAADGKLVILDEDGKLYLATATPESLVVHSQTQLLDGVAWTVPTIVGSTLYVRDTKRILAIDLG